MLFFTINTLITISNILTIPTTQVVSLENKQGGNNEFYCGTLENEYALMVEMPDGEIKTLFTVGDWASASGWLPRKRCDAIAERFQKYYNRGILKKMTTGEVESYPVICVVEKHQEICDKNNLLFTLDRGVDAKERLSNLSRTTPRVSQNAGRSTTNPELATDGDTTGDNDTPEEDARLFIDIEAMIEGTPAENNTNWLN